MGIVKYQGRSGVHWDNENGANINTEAEANVWNEYISHKVRQFQTCSTDF
jgi:hypothetical protein